MRYELPINYFLFLWIIGYLVWPLIFFLFVSFPLCLFSHLSSALLESILIAVRRCCRAAGKGGCESRGRGDVVWRAHLSDLMTRPMLWCEGYCQEMGESQHRYAQYMHCPQAGTGCDTLVEWWEGKRKLPRVLSWLERSVHCRVLTWRPILIWSTLKCVF